MCAPGIQPGGPATEHLFCPASFPVRQHPLADVHSDLIVIDPLYPGSWSGVGRPFRWATHGRAFQMGPPMGAPDGPGQGSEWAPDRDPNGLPQGSEWAPEGLQMGSRGAPDGTPGLVFERFVRQRGNVRLAWPTRRSLRRVVL